MNNQAGAPIMIPNNNPDNEKTDRREVNVIAAVSLAILLALFIVLVGVVAFKNSEVSTDVEVLESGAVSEDLEYPGQLTADQIDDEVRTIVEVVDDLETNVSELNNQDLSDNNLELE